MGGVVYISSGSRATREHVGTVLGFTESAGLEAVLVQKPF